MKANTAIHAELTGTDSCSALGITVSAGAPVLALCRKLIKDGYDPSMPLEAWRGSTLCLRVRSIGEAAKLDVDGSTRFCRSSKIPHSPPDAFKSPRRNGTHATVTPRR
jgi:hypothetical protein